MQVATRTVTNGKIVLEGAPVPKGAVVTVVTRGADESFTLTEAQEDELLAAMAEIDPGELVSLEELIKSCLRKTEAEHGAAGQDRLPGSKPSSTSCGMVGGKSSISGIPPCHSQHQQEAIPDLVRRHL